MLGLAEDVRGRPGALRIARVHARFRVDDGQVPEYRCPPLRLRRQVARLDARNPWADDCHVARGELLLSMNSLSSSKSTP